MDVDSEGGVDVNASAGVPKPLVSEPHICTMSEAERWLVPSREIVRRRDREDWVSREKLIQEKIEAVRCQRRRISLMKRRLQEARDRTSMEDGMADLVGCIGKLSLGYYESE
jgi:hypothetical protein